MPEDEAHILCQEVSYGLGPANSAAFDDCSPFVQGVDSGGGEGTVPTPSGPLWRPPIPTQRAVPPAQKWSGTPAIYEGWAR